MHAYQIDESASASKWRCWGYSAALGFAFPILVLVLKGLTAWLFPAAVHGSAQERFLLGISAGLIVEWGTVLALWTILRRRGLSLGDLGVWRFGTWSAWIFALAFAALSITSNLRFLALLHIPISYAFLPPIGIHLFGALTLGITAGFCEEVAWRGFLMTEFRDAGFSKSMQVVVPGIVFGLSHLTYLNQGIANALGIMIPTAFLGMMWGIAYLWGRRGLLPCIAAHFLNDATALPWIVFFMMTGSAQ